MLVLSSSAILSGCFVQPDDGSAAVAVRLALPDSPEKSRFPRRNLSPRMDLDYRAAFHFSVSAPDLDEVISASDELAAGDESETLEATLRVPAGSARRFQAVLFVAGEESFASYATEKAVSVDLHEGETKDLELTVRRLPVGTVETEIPGNDEDLYLYFTDRESGIRLAAAACKVQTESESRLCRHESVPVGRELIPGLGDADEEQDFDAQAFTLTEAGQALILDVTWE